MRDQKGNMSDQKGNRRDQKMITQIDQIIPALEGLKDALHRLPRVKKEPVRGGPSGVALLNQTRRGLRDHRHPHHKTKSKQRTRRSSSASDDDDDMAGVGKDGPFKIGPRLSEKAGEDRDRAAGAYDSDGTSSWLGGDEASSSDDDAAQYAALGKEAEEIRRQRQLLVDAAHASERAAHGGDNRELGQMYGSVPAAPPAATPLTRNLVGESGGPQASIQKRLAGHVDGYGPGGWSGATRSFMHEEYGIADEPEAEAPAAEAARSEEATADAHVQHKAAQAEAERAVYEMEAAQDVAERVAAKADRTKTQGDWNKMLSESESLKHPHLWPKGDSIAIGGHRVQPLRFTRRSRKSRKRRSKKRRSKKRRSKKRKTRKKSN